MTIRAHTPITPPFKDLIFNKCVVARNGYKKQNYPKPNDYQSHNVSKCDE